MWQKLLPCLACAFSFMKLKCHRFRVAITGIVIITILFGLCTVQSVSRSMREVLKLTKLIDEREQSTDLLPLYIHRQQLISLFIQSPLVSICIYFIHRARVHCTWQLLSLAQSVQALAFPFFFIWPKCGVVASLYIDNSRGCTEELPSWKLDSAARLPCLCALLEYPAKALQRLVTRGEAPKC